ncbi:MAG: DUF6600 domain-containing protein [Povalibacter sp.]
MRNFLLVCLFSLSGLALAQEPVGQPEPVIEEQGATQDSSVAEDSSAAPPAIEQKAGQQANPAVDPPSRVARLSLTEGEVSLAPAGTEEWAEAILNRPLTTGDRLWVDSGARAELQVGSATIHLDQSTGISFVNLDDDVLRVSLTEGSANIRVLNKRENERIEIETPNATVTLLHPGEYHIEATSAGDQTVVRTRNGDSEVTSGSKVWRVGGNQQGVFSGTKELTARIERLGPRTAFEDWANDRNRRSEGSTSSQYVSSEVIGYEDLDRNGRWSYEPEYGYVWAPTYVSAGWAPYRYGRWVWVSPWGWSWVDNTPWGFAPFHYGRWGYLNSRWCWVPGPRHLHPVYAPALVAWTSGPGVSVSVSFGSGIGWFPLGPREVYVPGYHYSRHYLNNVNYSNTVIVNNTYISNVYNGRYNNFDYRYGRNPRAVTIVERERFVSGRPLQGHFSNFSESDLNRWNRDPRPPALAPSRDSVFASRVLGRIPGRSITEPQAARLTSSSQTVTSGRGAAARVPFDVERREIEANGGRPIGRSQLIRPNSRGEVANTLSSDPAQQWRGAREPSGSDPRARLRRGDDNADRTSRSGSVTEQSQQPGLSNPALSNRPSWAGRQRDPNQRNAAGSADPRFQNGVGSGSQIDPSVLRRRDPAEERRNQQRALQENRTGTSANPLSRQAAPAEDRGQFNNRSGVTSDRSQQWRADDTRQRIQHSAPVEQNRTLGNGTTVERREWRAPSPQQSQPRFESPPQQPRQIEQPRRYEAPVRTQQPQMSTPQPQPRMSTPQPRSDNSNSSSRSQNNGRSADRAGRQGIQQQR